MYADSASGVGGGNAREVAAMAATFTASLEMSHGQAAAVAARMCYDASSASTDDLDDFDNNHDRDDNNNINLNNNNDNNPHHLQSRNRCFHDQRHS